MSGGDERDDDREREAFDVVMPHAATDDGQGARVLRMRPGKLEAGEIRAMREGKPIVPGGEVVRLERRKDAPALYDVKVEHTVEAPDKPAEAARASHGPAQVATKEYRDSWERTFGPRRARPN